MEEDGFGAFADAPAAAALPTDELWPKGDTLAPADYYDGDSGAAPPPAPRLSGAAQAPAEHAQEPAADSFGSFTEPANDAQAAAAAAQDETGFGAFADAPAAACDSRSRTAAPLAAAPAGGDAQAPGLVCGSLTDAPAAAPAAAAQADQDDEDDGFGDFADAPAAAAGIDSAPFAVSSLSNALAAAPCASAPAEDEDDDGFGTFAEAPAAAASVAAASPSLADEADCFGTFREAVVEPVNLAPPSTPVAYTSDLRGLKSPAFMVAAHKLLALDVGAESDAAQTEPSHVAPLDALLRGEAGAPAFVPPSPRMLAAAGLVQGGRSAAGGAPLWEGSPAQRRMHVLLNVSREETTPACASILRQHSSSHAEAKVAPAGPGFARALSAPADGAFAGLDSLAAAPPAAAGPSSAARDLGSSFGLPRARATPLAALLRRAPQLSFMLSNVTVPKW